MTLTEMRRVLTDGSVRLTCSMGQSFLHDGDQLRRMVATAGLSRCNLVLGIGPGLGPLTEQLREHAGTVGAIEKDRRLFEFLKDRYRGATRLSLLQADALDEVRKPRDWSDWKVVSNLPYSVASPIL